MPDPRYDWGDLIAFAVVLWVVLTVLIVALPCLQAGARCSW